jgi:hypothetical protein
MSYSNWLSITVNHAEYRYRYGTGYVMPVVSKLPAVGDQLGTAKFPELTHARSRYGYLYLMSLPVTTNYRYLLSVICLVPVPVRDAANYNVPVPAVGDLFGTGTCTWCC